MMSPCSFATSSTTISAKTWSTGPGDGGVLVVFDSGSPLRPTQSEDPFLGLDPDQVDPGFCTIDALRDVGAIAPGDTSSLDVGGLEAETCFGDGQIAFVAAQPEDDGTLVATGGPEFALNDRLDERDNSVLAAALLVPTGSEQVQFVEAVAPIGGGDETLVELVPDGVWRALAQLGLAFVLYALWRAIRFGRPVAEPQPVAIAGSELVEATGRLLQRTLDPGRAAEVVRADLRLAVARRLGVPRRAGIDGTCRRGQRPHRRRRSAGAPGTRRRTRHHRRRPGSRHRRRRQGPRGSPDMRSLDHPGDPT